ncbi:unnamed protein product [Urochloa humidicola]
MAEVAELKKDMTELVTTVRDLAKSVKDASTKIEELAAKLDKLAPLAPMASKLADLPDKVVTLQAASFEHSEQVRALNLAVIRLEKSQPDGKRREEETTDKGASNDGPLPKRPAGSAPPPLPPPFRETPPPPFREPPPHRHRRGPLDDDDDDSADPRFHPRARIEFPTFDGKEDPLPWLNRCETFFRCQNTPERRRVTYAALHLTGTAQLWYYRLELTSGTPSWRRFAQLVQQRFGPPMTDSPVGEIMLLRRSGSVEDYTDKFLTLACRDADLTEAQLVHMFTAGLVNPLKTDVALRRPATLDDAIMLARAYEQRQLLSPSDNIGTLSSSPPRPEVPASSALSSSSATGATTMASVSSAPAGSGLSTPLAASLPRRRLTPAEVTQRRADGLCYNCDEKYTVGHRCKKLFVIEVFGFNDNESEL